MIYTPVQSSHYYEQPFIKVNLVSQGVTVPLTVAEFKTSLNIEVNDFDADIEADFLSATLWAEQYCGKCFTGSTFKQYQNKFWRQNEIWFPVLSSISLLQYIDVDNTLQTLTNYQLLQSTDGKSCVFFDSSQTLPLTANRPDAVQISFSTVASTNPILKKAVKLIVGTWFDYRSNELDITLKEMNMGAIRLLNMLKEAQL